MFTVQRQVLNIDNGVRVSNQSYEHKELADALDCMDCLRRQDSARYKVFTAKKPDFFADHKYDDTGYHYTIGKCKIICEILGLYESAVKEFFIDNQ